ncbi:MAG: hypothetical protein HY689_11555 [Chloroflexi bacterium]|nr:hypothetical protein [Chloroflexota bacterium]
MTVSASRREGIYLNRQSNQVRRVGIGVVPPAGDEWVQVTQDPNATLLTIRQLAQEQNLSSAAESIQWEF